VSAVLGFRWPSAGPLQELARCSEGAFDANRAWEVDRAEMMARSERRAWRVAGSSITVALSAVLAVVAHGPLQKVIEVPIVVDKQTGETTIQQRLAIETVPHLDTLDKHNAAAFVRAREGYSWWWLQRDFDQVARMAVPAVFADYNRQFEGEAALQKKLSATEEWRVNVISVRLSAAKRQGNRGEATVTYEKSVRLTDRNLPDTVTRHVATLVYEYQPKALAKEKDRIENPFGFVVIAYRSDPEISTATPAAPGKV
jgi:type IV secretion system protein VirB8